MPSKTEDAVSQNGNLEVQTSARLSAKAAVKSDIPAQKKQASLDIIDIRQHAIELDLGADIMPLLNPDKGPKTLPTLLLYDEKGLQTFEEITYLDEYYLTSAEIDVLTKSANEIAQNIQDGSMVIELGSGNLRKVSILLQALDSAGKQIDYYALDLSQRELERTLSDVPNFKHVICHGLLGTYDDGEEWIRSGCNASRPKCILSLGSSIGNFDRHEAPQFLRKFAELLRPSDSMLIGLDACNDPAKVYRAYNDSLGVTHRFILNGLEHANELLNENVFDIKDWKVIGEYVFDIDGGRHQAFYAPNKDVTIRGVSVREGERVQVEQSLKYSAKEAEKLWEASGLKEVGKWTASKHEYNVHMMTRRDKPFHLQPAQYASSIVPTLEDWRGLWSTWDTVTRGMIPNHELLNKPIKLRNACIFYLGHIPTFLDIQLNKATGDPLCEPSYYTQIFERGIDPDVDNPEQCHAHSEIPDEWPPVEEILNYQAQVRRKVEQLYATKTATSSRNIGRSLWAGFEHEIMHLETLLYMLLQSDSRLDPPRTVKPNFKEDAEKAASEAIPNEWFSIPEQTITVGLEDPQDNSGPDNHFGWDNEKPVRKIYVKAFEAQGRPITNAEYACYLEATGKEKIPASWLKMSRGNGATKLCNGYLHGHNGHHNGYTNGYQNGSTNGTTNGFTNGHITGHSEGYNNGHINELDEGIDASSKPSKSYMDGKTIRTVYGLIPLEFALHWPVFASYDELAGCAAWFGGRIPTADEVRSIYSYADKSKQKEAEQHLGSTLPAVNAHLLNNGVEETPPSREAESVEGSLELFTDLEGANVGFKHWHPVAVTAYGNKLAGQGEMGGVWEWTSTTLEKHEGFEPMALYPGYTADFFDGKHNIVLGGSWATHPRIAGRKTFVNWYQRNYLYAWVGARLVRDL